PISARFYVIPVILGLCLLLVVPLGAAQPANEPQREQLLNGLQLLLWEKPGSSEVLLKLRINSGAAFDLSGKSGQMALLGDLLFPDPNTVQYFTEEMDGKLEVAVNYDSTTITMVGKAAEFEQIVDTLRAALLSTQLTPEIVARVRDARIKTLKDSAIAPPLVADRAIATRLFGDFPYGRLVRGTPEDLARVDRADLMLARDRFLNSNNATLAIVGGVTRARTMRTLRQLLGPWRKSENIIPTTFRQPKAPDQRTLIVNVPGPAGELRLAMRGVSRTDPDYFPAKVLAKLAEQRWQGLTPELVKQPVFARSESYALPGAFMMGTTVDTQGAADALANARKVIDSLMTTPATAAELERAKTEAIGEVSGLLSKPEAFPDPWLDLDTYHLSSLQDQIALFHGVTAQDLQRIATRLFKDATIASVIAGETTPLKAALQGRFPYEVLGEMATPTPSPKPPATPGAKVVPG
ncbi:MAG TPA: insulinase family protein, partial [Pyrinomonadaceae bacterium]|nr:insulinase family protein [Pyrinomonadaceae bacterium]